jgi:hypothetical protein
MSECVCVWVNSCAYFLVPVYIPALPPIHVHSVGRYAIQDFSSGCLGTNGGTSKEREGPGCRGTHFTLLVYHLNS